MRKSQELGKNPTEAPPCRGVECRVGLLMLLRPTLDTRHFKQRDGLLSAPMLETQICSTARTQATIFPPLENRGELWTNY